MKTIESAAKEYADNQITSEFTEYGNCIRGFYAGVEFAQRWMAVSEVLPSENVMVLIKWEDEDCDIAKMIGSEIWVDKMNMELCPPLYWRSVNNK